MPVNDDVDSGNFASRLPAFNGQSGATDGFAGVFGSASYYDNGANLTLVDIRNLFETSSLDMFADMLTWPRWFPLDSENVTVDQLRDRLVTLGDVTDATGCRSGAIQRLDDLGDRRNTYFELEIIDEGDTNQATLVGLRRLAESGGVGGVSENPEDAIYIKGGKLYDGANVVLPTGSGEDEQDGSTLANAVTGQVFRFAIAWNEFNPQMLWVGDGSQWKGQAHLPAGAVGIESGGILDGALTASSEFLPNFESFKSRLNGTHGWAASSAAVDEWIKVDLGEVRSIHRIDTQGNGNLNNEWVLTYDLEVSDDDSDWTEHPDNPIATGNVDRTTVATQNFTPIDGRYVRLRVQTWTLYPTMRWEVYANDDPDPETLTNGLGFMDTAYNWAAWVRTNGADGNGVVRLRAKAGEFLYPVPAGFVAWDDPDGLVLEDAPSGVGLWSYNGIGSKLIFEVVT